MSKNECAVMAADNKNEVGGVAGDSRSEAGPAQVSPDALWLLGAKLPLTTSNDKTKRADANSGTGQTNGYNLSYSSQFQTIGHIG